MENRWSEQAAADAVDRYGARHGEDLALRTYSSRLIGAEPALVLHGGGNTSLKGSVVDVFGERLDALFVKASSTPRHLALRLRHRYTHSSPGATSITPTPMPSWR
jgi:rhamnose utilization protein RhaD (predicted bifunctional aldolase and dehydrogenase)